MSLGTYRVFDEAGVHSYLVVGCRIYSVKTILETQNDQTPQSTAGHAVTSVDHREPVRKFEMRTLFSFIVHHLIFLRAVGTVTISVKGLVP